MLLLIANRAQQALATVLSQAQSLKRHMRLSYLPPLMVYLAAGVSGLTGIVGTFFVKDYLDLPAEFLAMLGFWVGLSMKKTTLNHSTSVIFIHGAMGAFPARRDRGVVERCEPPPKYNTA